MRYAQLGPVLGKHWKKLAIALCLVAVLLVAYLDLSRLTGTTTRATSAASGISLGFSRLDRPAPAFDLPRLQGHGKVTLSQLAGQPIVLNFWASTCTVCRQESPAIARVARAARDKVAFLGVDTLDSRAAAMAFIRRYKISYPVAFDARGSAAARYGVPGLPVTFFLSPTGHRIIGRNVGALTAHALTTILRRLYGTLLPASGRGA
jgi:cytochrome c biogenesis protein CcmG, thiol:disulfide interchange protein DsbE